MDRWARAIERPGRPLGVVMSAVGAVALIVMMLWVVTDVLLRFLFNRPVLGSYEIVEYMMVAFIFMAMAHAQFSKAHISVPVFVERLSPEARAVVESITSLVTLAIALVMVWGAIGQTRDMYLSRMTSAVLFIPKWPFQAITALGLALFSVAVLVDVLKNLTRVGGQEGAGDGAEELRTL
ncbi:MAG: TRAP transporter small permease [Chloroflexota bacterium]